MTQLISDIELAEYGKTEPFSQKAMALVNQQKATWELAASGYRLLNTIETRVFLSDELTVICQFNPGRFRSSAANTSAGAILARPCFLCSANRPEEQCEIPFGEEMVILTNPFPIFPYHLTIPSVSHLPQQISGNLEIMADLSRALDGFTILYNGPRCGASAPDHLHFQAGLKGIMPLENDLKKIPVKRFQFLAGNKELAVRSYQSACRRFFLLTSTDKESLVQILEILIRLIDQNEGEEPMLNILSWYEAGFWNVVLFPRALQRPFQYYAKGDEKLLVSPAAVELGGLVILPREEDFRRIAPEDLDSIFSQVSMGNDDFELLKKRIGRL